MPDKRAERLYFQQLRKCIPQLPAGALSEHEPPDFVVGSSPRVGVEITTFYLPPALGSRPRQELDRLRERTVRLAEELHTSAGGPPLYVTAAFSDHRRLTKDRTRSVAEQLSNAVLGAPVPESLSEGCVRLSWRELPDGFEDIRIYASIDGVDRLWHASRSGWVAPVLPEHVQAIITKKERSVERARANCDQLWLVIVHNTFALGSPAEMRQETVAANYDTSFDKVYWFEPHSSAVLELCASRRLTSA